MDSLYGQTVSLAVPVFSSKWTDSVLVPIRFGLIVMPREQ
jgi:hypothetical protein